MSAPRDESKEPEAAPAAFTIEQVDVEVVRPLRHKHLRPDQPEDAVCYQSDGEETCCHFAAKDLDGNVIASGSLNQEDRVAGQPPFGHPGMRIRGIAVEDEWRGKGVGAGMVAYLLEYGRTNDLAEAWGNARTENLRFYAKNGFTEVSGPFEIPTIGEHVVVALSLQPKGRKARKALKAKDQDESAGDESTGDGGAAAESADA